NGIVELYGAGNDTRNLVGKGRLVISPAELYDLPLIVAIFNALVLVPSSDAAFDQAAFDFKIRDSNVFFDKIDLVGDSVHLVGGGKVAFKGDVNLEFLSDV